MKMDWIQVVNTALSLLSVICATTAVYFSYKSIKVWHSQMKNAAGFPALSDVMGKLTAYQDITSRLIESAEAGLPKLINGSIEVTDYLNRLKLIADEKFPMGTFRDASQMMELVYSGFDKQPVIDLISEVKQLVLPIREWKTENDVWTWLESQTKLNREMTQDEKEKVINEEPLFIRQATINLLISEIEEKTKACVKEA